MDIKYHNETDISLFSTTNYSNLISEKIAALAAVRSSPFAVRLKEKKCHNKKKDEKLIWIWFTASEALHFCHRPLAEFGPSLVRVSIGGCTVAPTAFTPVVPTSGTRLRFC